MNSILALLLHEGQHGAVVIQGTYVHEAPQREASAHAYKAIGPERQQAVCFMHRDTRRLARQRLAHDYALIEESLGPTVKARPRARPC